MATFPSKVNYATGDVLTATNMNDVGGAINLLDGAQYAAGKNKIINGDFSINQRAFTSVTATGTYMFDRYGPTIGGTSGTATFTPQTFTPGAAPVSGYEGKNFLQLVTASYTVADSWAGFAQSIESVRTFAGQTVTFSFWAKATSGTPKLGIRVQQSFGSGGSPSTAVNTYATVSAISTSWARYSVTVAVPSISGKTLGTSGDDKLTITLVSSAGSTTFEGSFGSMLQNNTFQFWGWQVEAASTASPFQTASGSIQGELALCQRYYFRNTTTLAYGNLIPFSGIATSTTSVIYSFQPPVPMRATPTAIDYSTLAAYDGTTAATASVAAFSGYQNANAIGVTLTVTGATAQRSQCIISNNSTSAYIGFSADI